MNKRTIIIGSLALLGAGYGLGLHYGELGTTNQFNYKYPYPMTYKAPGELVDQANRIGLDVNELVKTRALIGLGKGSCLPDADGCYDPSDGTIRISVSAFTQDDPGHVLAYEYEHYAWDHLSPTEQTSIKPELDGLVQRLSGNKEFQRNYEFFTREGATPGTPSYYNELFSVACTNLQDNDISNSLLGVCSRQIKNRVWPRPS